MTPAHFLRAVTMSGLGAQSLQVTAAYEVLVRGMTQSAAARAMSIDRAAVHRAVRRIQAASERCPCCGRAF